MGHVIMSFETRRHLRAFSEGKLAHVFGTQVFGPYAAPADTCWGPRCTEEGQVHFYKFPSAADAAVVALRR